MPRIKVLNVTKTYGAVKALRDVSLEIQDGEYLSIVGPSGCGKTTLIKCIAGIIRPDRGEIYIDDIPVVALPIEDRNLGYVFQEIALFPHMSLWDNVSYGLMVKGMPPSKRRGQVREMLGMMGLEERANAYPRELSGGARQKTALARALASGAKLLLLDEPLGALDAKVRAKLRYELRSLVKDLGLTAIHVTHDQEEALSISDRVAIMRAGSIVEVGAPWDLYMHPRHIFTARFLGEANFMEGRVVGISGGDYLIDVGGLDIMAPINPSIPLESGKPCVLAIRPEFLRLMEKVRGSSKANLLRGTVRDGVFLGNSFRYEVEVKEGIRLSARHPVFLGELDLQPGDQVYVEIPKGRILVFPYPEGGLEAQLSLE
ncbi:ABC transporter ATP-binding protein [Candidatus Bathyarchaeota archaeon]|nr:ABC transporter ATP-binding protein [Candidatus Bathyarchaeota archaeon]